MFLKVNPDAAQGVAPDPAGLVGEYLKVRGRGADVGASCFGQTAYAGRLF